MTDVVAKFATNKTLIAAIIAMARMFIKELRLPPNVSMTAIATQLEVNRNYVYEVQQRVTAHLLPLLEMGPGRPANPTPPSAESDRSKSDQLTIDVLRYRAEHPGAVVEHADHKNYSDAFKYFILNRYDDECGLMTQEEFAKAAEIPVETLRTWLAQDRAPLLPENAAPKPKAIIPVDAAEIVHTIARHFEIWEGSTRDFIRHAVKTLELKANQIKRVLCIVKLLSLPQRRTYRYRGSTERLAPGTMLVTDGKELSIHLTASHEHLKLNWQAMIDQTTGTDVGFAITPNENATGIKQALEAALYFMSGQAPAAILCDNKPCYDDAALQEKIKPICDVIKATPGRGENKAIVEGSFSLFEQRIGPIRLDDSSKSALIQSAVHEIIRTYTATTNHVPRAEFDGKTRAQVFYEYVPDPRQQAKDEAFLKRLKAQHERPFSRRAKPDPRSRELLDDAFTRCGLLPKDPSGNLRAFLSESEPAAIKTAVAIFRARQERGKVKAQWAHRYLGKLIRNMQEELDLQRCEDELLHLNREQAQNWTCEQERLYDQLRGEIAALKDLSCRVAEKAAEGEVPVAAAFWREQLWRLLINAKELIPAVRTHLRRMSGADFNLRLLLINELTELEYGLRAA
ncbi:MAG: hypothetical protein ACREOO_11915 [bacterium]